MAFENFTPDYTHILDASFNREAKRLPLYEHTVAFDIVGKLTGHDELRSLYFGDDKDVDEFFKIYSSFFGKYGYDTVCFEACVGPVMPGSGALGGHKDGVIKTYQDFERYPWDEVEDCFFKEYTRYFDALERHMPVGMKAIGGVGNGIFECVQDIVGYTDLCYISYDDPELYANLFKKVGEVNLAIWKRFLARYNDLYVTLRFGDDLGYKSATLLPADDVITHIIPQYKLIIDEVHRYNKPFLLHSCGCIFDVMEDIITVAGVNAKHSNEDAIATFDIWVEKYGDRIGNFGGIDLDVVCRADRAEMREYIHTMIDKCKGHGGFAFGTGNSIADYVSPDGFLAMVEIVREYRGD